MIRQHAIIQGPVHKALVERTGTESSGARCAVFIDPERVISAGDDGVLRLWSVVDGQELQNYNAGFDTLVLCLSPHRNLVAAAGGSLRGLSVWDLKSGECRWQQEAEMYIGGLSFSPDGEILFCKPLHNPAVVYRTEDGKELSKSSTSNSVEAVRPMSSGLALCADDTSLSLISLQEERLIWLRDDALEDDFYGDFKLFGQESLGAVVAGEKQLLMVRAADGATALVELQFPDELNFEFTNLFAISDDGALLCALGSDSNLHLFSLPDGRYLAALEHDSLDLTEALLFAPDNCRILALQGLDRPQVVFHFEWEETPGEPDWQQLEWQELAVDPLLEILARLGINTDQGYLHREDLDQHIATLSSDERLELTGTLLEQESFGANPVLLFHALFKCQPSLELALATIQYGLPSADAVIHDPWGMMAWCAENAAAYLLERQRDGEKPEQQEALFRDTITRARQVNDELADLGIQHLNELKLD